jgi:hypothetical protein
LRVLQVNRLVTRHGEKPRVLDHDQIGKSRSRKLDPRLGPSAETRARWGEHDEQRHHPDGSLDPPAQGEGNVNDARLRLA